MPSMSFTHSKTMSFTEELNNMINQAIAKNIQSLQQFLMAKKAIWDPWKTL